jgi:sortase A
LRKLRAIQIFGYLCFVGFLFIVSLLVYQLWISNYFSDRAATDAREELLLSWNRPTTNALKPSTPVSASTTTEPQKAELVTNQKPFALIYIPRINDDVWGLPIFEGVSSKQLNSGIGHYPQSASLGEEGNFSLFGHRTSNGQPFSNIQKLRVGDQVIIETRDFWYVYQLEFDRIVKPNAMWVTSSERVPELGITESDPYNVITLITCEPRYSTSQRWVWWGALQSILPHSNTPIDANAQP